MKKRLKFNQLAGKYQVCNEQNEYLGDIEFYKDWNCWVFMPDISTIYSVNSIPETYKIFPYL